MNQDQVKEKLLELRDDVPEFTLLFSGKKSKKVDGLYKPEIREILIHNKNHETENEIIYTAIHEFAHHIQFYENPLQKSSRSHNTAFGNIFHKLLFLAEQKGIFKNIYKTDPDFIKLTKNIKENYLVKHGNLMKEFGSLLYEAMELCMKKNVRFEDYLSRELLMNKSEANNMIKVSISKINPAVGYDNMKMLTHIADDDRKEEMEKAMLETSITPAMIKEEIRRGGKPENKLEMLLSEKARIQRAIANLESTLKHVSEKIKELKTSENEIVFSGNISEGDE
jgi:hypothetical protein